MQGLANYNAQGSHLFYKQNFIGAQPCLSVYKEAMLLSCYNGKVEWLKQILYALKPKICLGFFWDLYRKSFPPIGLQHIFQLVYMSYY